LWVIFWWALIMRKKPKKILNKDNINKESVITDDEYKSIVNDIENSKTSMDVLSTLGITFFEANEFFEQGKEIDSNTLKE